MKKYVDMEILRNSVECKYGYDDETDTDFDIEKFNEIYEGVCEGELYFKIEDIINVFKLFIIDDQTIAEDMQGFQQDKIRELTIFSLNQNNLKEALLKYAQGLKILYDYMQLHEDYPLYLYAQIEGCLRYLISEKYELEYFELFFKEINSYSQEFKIALKKIIIEMIGHRDNQRYKEEFLNNIK